MLPAFIAAKPHLQPFSKHARRNSSKASICMCSERHVRVDKPTTYKDGAYGRACIAYLRASLRPLVGWQSPRKGYDGLVEECRMLMVRTNSFEQRKQITEMLQRIFLAPIGPKLFRTFFAHNPQLNANLTSVYFQWLVGPATRKDPEEGGAGVHIEKCRFLEESGCKGLSVTTFPISHSRV